MGAANYSWINPALCIALGILFVISLARLIGILSSYQFRSKHPYSTKLELLILINSAFCFLFFPKLIVPAPEKITFLILLPYLACLFQVLFSSYIFIRYLFPITRTHRPEIRFAHRTYFLFGIFILPLALLGVENLQTLTLAWMISYLINATINRMASGHRHPELENEPQGDDPVWIKIGSKNLLSDIFRFRSEFSVNNPGSHRETFESFYPYFNLLCLIFVIACQAIPRSQTGVSLDAMLTTVDGSVFNGVVTYQLEKETPANRNPLLAETVSRNMGTPSDTVAKHKNLADIFTKTANGDRTPDSLPTPPTDPELTIRSIDLINLRNFFVVMVLFATVWVVNTKRSGGAYVDKWKVLMTELHNLQAAPTETKKLQFAANLIVTEMWGHRSFSQIFKTILTTHDLLKNSHLPDQYAEVAPLLEAINKKISTTLQKTP